jgi:glycosyltransferase involved in cell wall biosynthesis
MKTYTILQLIGGGELGGAEHHVLTLLKGFSPKHFSLLSGCLIDGPFAQLTEENSIPTLRFPMKHALDLSPLPQLIKEGHRQNISLIHTHGSRANLLGRLAGRWLKIPVVSTVHSSLKHDYLSPKAAYLALTLDRLTIPLTSGIITVSEALANEVANRGGQNIRTIYNGISPLPNFSEQTYRTDLRHKLRQQWGIASDALVIGSIARLHPTKGLGYLIEAAKRIQTNYPNLHLLIIGEGPLRSELETQLKGLNLRFTLTGYLPDAYQALPVMDLFTLPSINEGMGLVLLEAMQAHVPIVATQVGGIPEVIRDGKDGLLVPPKNSEALSNACIQILGNPGLSKALIESGTMRWSKFGVPEMLRQTKEFYQEILQK